MRYLRLALLPLLLVGCADRGSVEPEISPDMQPQFCEWDVALGRMTGGGVVRLLADNGDLVRVTNGFTLHCDVLLSNNLEINWAGNQWHIEKESLSEVLCTDDPAVSPEPPPAPFDTFEAWAVGRFNGEWGYPIHFILQDAGEPAGKSDMAMLEIFDPSGALVLSVPWDVIVNGNIQAHYDQPHGSKP